MYLLSSIIYTLGVLSYFVNTDSLKHAFFFSFNFFKLFLFLLLFLLVSFHMVLRFLDSGCMGMECLVFIFE